VPDKRGLGRVNVVCIKALACVFWWEEGKKRGTGGWVMDPKVGPFTLSMGPARAGVRSYIQRATILRKRDVYTLKYSKNATHAIINNTCLIWKVK
jgi:hypothetical protein